MAVIQNTFPKHLGNYNSTNPKTYLQLLLPKSFEYLYEINQEAQYTIQPIPSTCNGSSGVGGMRN